jgi:RNA polymerase sigma-70 factor (ECF subfamily)
MAVIDAADAATVVSGSDVELLRAAWRGDDAAFAVLVKRHERLLHGYVRARLSVAADVEDICQEAFLRLFTGKTVPPEAAAGLRPWLLGIARNVLLEFVRRAKRREHAWTELCLEIEERNAVDGVSEDSHDEAIQRLPDCIQGLGPSARQAIDMYYGCGQRMRDMAQQLRRSEGAVKLLVHRARQALKRCLDAARTEDLAS